MRALSVLFGFRERVTRRAYLAWGLGLAALKFALDTALVYAFTGKTWSPLGYVVPSMVLREDSVGPAPGGLLILLPILALPFLWIGLTMSVRRAADAGLSPWIGTLFVVPFVNYVVITALAAWPPAADPVARPPALEVYRRAPPSPDEMRGRAGVVAAVAGIAPSAALGVAMLMLSVYGLGMYGTALFFVTPFAMGATSAALYNRRRARSLGATLGVVTASIALAGAIPLLFALEGLLCVLMAAPIALAIAWIGALVGRAIANAGRESRALRGGATASMVLLGLPAIALGEAQLAQPSLHDVTTSIEIDAPPERVWPNVIGFSELREPPAWFFRLGIAYPKRARIDGAGVGAVRHCEFSTGPFVEPIEVWEPPTRLAFEVTSQPPSMTEWSPYAQVHAPHVEGYMQSKGGEFDLVALPGGRTRLEGTTHYTLAIYPESYWIPYAELLLHAIHQRVLVHIKALSEGRAG